MQHSCIVLLNIYQIPSAICMDLFFSWYFHFLSNIEVHHMGYLIGNTAEILLLGFTSKRDIIYIKMFHCFFLWHSNTVFIGTNIVSNTVSLKHSIFHYDFLIKYFPQDCSFYKGWYQPSALAYVRDNFL